MPILSGMKRSILEHILLVGLLVAGLAIQSMTNAASMGSGEDRIVSVTAQKNATDQILIDLAASICTKGKADKDSEQACHCLHCVLAGSQFLVFPGADIVSRLAFSIAIEQEFNSQVRPPSRRLPGDGPSRAPPSVA